MGEAKEELSGKWENDDDDDDDDGKRQENEKRGGKTEDEQGNGRKMNKWDSERGIKERGMGKWEQKKNTQGG